MDRERRIELCWVVVAIVTAGAIAAFASPFPPLERAIESEAWTRGVEFVLLVMVLWMLMSAIGLIRAKIGVGLDGLTAERLSEDTNKSRKTLEGMQEELSRLQSATAHTAEAIAAATSQSLEDYDKRIVALEHTVGTLSSGDNPDAPGTLDV